MKKPFKPIKCSLCGIDEQATVYAFEDYVGGVAKADQILYLWKNSYPSGSKYDKVFSTGYYHSRKENFSRKALDAGFCQQDIDAFFIL